MVAVYRNARWEVISLVGELRTLGQQQYDSDIGRLEPVNPDGQSEAHWAEYTLGSERHAVLSNLCALARDRQLLNRVDHS
jgi:hypothetical protein